MPNNHIQLKQVTINPKIPSQHRNHQVAFLLLITTKRLRTTVRIPQAVTMVIMDTSHLQTGSKLDIRDHKGINDLHPQVLPHFPHMCLVHPRILHNPLLNYLHMYLNDPHIHKRPLEEVPQQEYLSTNLLLNHHTEYHRVLGDIRLHHRMALSGQHRINWDIQEPKLLLGLENHHTTPNINNPLGTIMHTPQGETNSQVITTHRKLAQPEMVWYKPEVISLKQEVQPLRETDMQEAGRILP